MRGTAERYFPGGGADRGRRSKRQVRWALPLYALAGRAWEPAGAAAACAGYSRARQAGARAATAGPGARGRRIAGTGNGRARTRAVCARDGRRGREHADLGTELVVLWETPAPARSASARPSPASPTSPTSATTRSTSSESPLCLMTKAPGSTRTALTVNSLIRAPEVLTDSGIQSGSRRRPASAKAAAVRTSPTISPSAITESLSLRARPCGHASWKTGTYSDWSLARSKPIRSRVPMRRAAGSASMTWLHHHGPSSSSAMTSTWVWVLPAGPGLV
jgi:hypothetical protein